MTVVIWLLVAAALVFVGWPLFRVPAGRDSGDVETVSPLERQKLDAYAGIKDAEFDRRMGKLSDEDFTAVTQRYRQQALAAISALEQAERAAASRRTRPPVRMMFCPACGVKLPPRANFCSGCGRALRDSAA